MISLALVCSVAGLAAAQQDEYIQRPIDQGYADVNPLQTSIKVQQIDLRRPTGFSDVFLVPGSDHLLSRSDGALTAVFPQSSYVSTREGVRAIVPAGTLFVIGPIPSELDAASSPRREHLYSADRSAGRMRLDTPIDLLNVGPMPVSVDAGSQYSIGPVRTEPVERTIWNDTLYRQHRVSTLLRTAAAADL